MAEVYLGTHQAMGGFRKLVVMKRLLGWQSGDEDAVESLLDEARIAATINHPNVVSTLDIGLDRGSPYIVLEYLSGEDLLFILHELRKRNASVPLGIACQVGASIAAALSQAHNLTLADGSKRCIVHRDVTPSNIIVCYGGITKLVDFGVARVSDDDGRRTKAGMVKGKFSYLAPEQLTCGPLDGRTDVFQLGIVMWEMVTMTRLFDGRSDPERVNAVLSRKIRRPSELNPALPTCLDDTIMRALDRNPDRRHQDASEFESELREALNALGSSGGDHSVGKWMQTAFTDRYQWRLELERRTVAKAEVTTTDADIDNGEVELRFDAASGPTVADRPSASNGTSLRGLAIEGAVAPPPQRSVARYLIPVVVIAAAAVWWWRVERGSSSVEPNGIATASASTPAANYEVDIRVVPATASIAIDGVSVATGHYRASFASDDSFHTVTFTAPDHTTVQRRFRGAATLEVSLEAIAPAVAAQPAPNVDATANAELADQTARATPSSTRHRHRERANGKTPSPVPGATATAPAANANTGSAPAPAPAKPPSDPFAPSSDNLDPFK
jgi:eukaryotic-like serine/threonine-protein kinase